MSQLKELYEAGCENCDSPANDSTLALPEADLSHEQLLANLLGLKSHDYVQGSYSSDLISCRGCDLVYRKNRPDPESIFESYKHESLNPEYDRAWKQTWTPIYQRLLLNLEKKTAGKKGRLLDLGAQLGLFPSIAQEFGWNAFGVDLSDYTINEAKKLHLPMVQSGSPQLPFKNEAFDALTCWTLFENLPKWKDDLSQLHRVLKPGGVIALKVANFDFYEKLTKYADNIFLRKLREEVLKDTHLYSWPYQFGFTPELIKQILLEAGFDEIEINNYQLAPEYQRGKNGIDKSIHNGLRKTINRMSNTIYSLTNGRTIGPWMEIYAKKSEKDTTLRIREIQESDQEIVKQFILEILHEYGFEYDSNLDFDLDDPVSYYTDKEGKFYLLEKGSSIIGTVAISNINNETAEIRRLYIAKNERNQGFGKKMINFALNYCRNAGLKQVIGNTTMRNKELLSLAQKRGFALIEHKGKTIFGKKVLM